MNTNLGYLFGAVCAGLFVLAFLAGGAYLIYTYYRSRKKVGQSASWPTAGGRVTTSRVRESNSTDSDGNSSRSFYPEVAYDYEVVGQIYHGKRLGFGPELGYASFNKAQEISARYPVNAVVMVSYDPLHPEEAVLEKSATGAKTALVIGIILVVIAFCLGCGGLIAALSSLFNS